MSEENRAADEKKTEYNPSWSAVAYKFIGDSTLKGVFEKYAEMKKQEAERQSKALVVVAAFFALVLAFVSCLVFVDKVSGEALVFMVGTVAGYLLTLLFKLTGTKEIVKL